MSASRRQFLKTSTAASAAVISSSYLPASAEKINAAEHRFQISLAEWSLHRTLRKGKLTNLDFPQYAKDKFGIHAVEYVNSFFKKQAKDRAYLKDLKSRTDSEGIRNVLIMCDGEGKLGAKTAAERAKTVDNHKQWVEAAKFLGCHSIRVNAAGSGSPEELAKKVTEGLRALSEFAKDFDVNVIVENHGGLSSDGAWLSAVLKGINMPNCGSLPDFGNFAKYDRYQGLKDLMPYAKGVSAKSNEFDEQGNEIKTDFLKAMKIVAASAYKGYVGIEYAGPKLSEDDGILATKTLLERVFKQI
ncbi:MAG: sugar phosphate isomerase/epimerase [Verrucomicrobiae bacterium]|nr:sugar phosphate isomerase/epimerase [Verrucomicrobiae bacterium]NNJ86729.1 TIM barrel protein [Akkermansiaceae bacterium]